MSYSQANIAMDDLLFLSDTEDLSDLIFLFELEYSIYSALFIELLPQ